MIEQHQLQGGPLPVAKWGYNTFKWGSNPFKWGYNTFNWGYNPFNKQA